MKLREMRRKMMKEGGMITSSKNQKLIEKSVAFMTSPTPTSPTSTNTKIKNYLWRFFPIGLS
jgi:hypothetical protein